MLKLLNAESIKSYRLRGLMGCLVCNPTQHKSLDGGGRIPLYSTDYADMLKRLYERGVYTIMRGNLLLLGPPLVITEIELDAALCIIEEVLVEFQDRSRT